MRQLIGPGPIKKQFSILNEISSFDASKTTERGSVINAR